MTDSQEPEYMFRVRLGCGHAEYIAADYMAVSMDGVIRLDIKIAEHNSATVAVIFPSEGLSVVRVDTLITMEGLTQP